MSVELSGSDNLDEKLEELIESGLSENEAKDAKREMETKKSRVTILGSHERIHFLKNIKIAIQPTYHGVIVEDMPHFKYETPRQKVHSFLSSSRFVMVDNCLPAGQLIELEYCRNSGVITAILVNKGKPMGSWMSIDFHIHSKDFDLFDYEKDDIDYLREFVKPVIKWAENRCIEREKDIIDVKKRYGYE